MYFSVTKNMRIPDRLCLEFTSVCFKSYYLNAKRKSPQNFLTDFNNRGPVKLARGVTPNLVNPPAFALTAPRLITVIYN
jgi:hypothetical protein